MVYGEQRLQIHLIIIHYQIKKLSIQQIIRLMKSRKVFLLLVYYLILQAKMQK
jgi:hypothetical protein